MHIQVQEYQPGFPNILKVYVFDYVSWSKLPAVPAGMSFQDQSAYMISIPKLFFHVHIWSHRIIETIKKCHFDIKYLINFSITWWFTQRHILSWECLKNSTFMSILGESYPI